jgi:hypothetical protein
MRGSKDVIRRLTPNSLLQLLRINANCNIGTMHDFHMNMHAMVARSIITFTKILAI